MPNWEWATLVIGCLTFASSIFGQLKRLGAWLKGWAVVTHKMDAEDAGYLISFLSQRMRRLGLSTRTYTMRDLYVKPLDKRYPVIYEHLHSTPQTFWRGLRAIRFSIQSGDEKVFSRAFSYIRGTCDWDKLMRAFAVWKHDRDEAQAGRRFFVRYVFGAERNDLQVSHVPHSEMGTTFGYRGYRLLDWDFDDLVRESRVTGLDMLSLAPPLVHVANEMKRWLASRSWYREHGVPWRRGYAFIGAPGTGKTALTRAAAENLDLPVYVFDLSSMCNRDLYSSWRGMMSSTPCIALIEDIDGVFHGRENISANALAGSVTFDALLNCIDGVESIDGVLLVITTNYPDKIDDALIARPGRVDRVVEFLPLDHAGRVKMAERIIGASIVANRLACEHTDDSAARFQERCVQIASARLYDGTRA